MKCSSRSVGCRNWLKVKDQVQTGRDDKVDAESDVTCDNDDDKGVPKKHLFKTKKGYPPTYPSGAYITQIQKLFLFGQV